MKEDKIKNYLKMAESLHGYWLYILKFFSALWLILLLPIGLILGFVGGFANLIILIDVIIEKNKYEALLKEAQAKVENKAEVK